MEGLLEDTSDTSTMNFDSPVEANDKPKSEDITTASLQRGIPLNSVEAGEARKEVSNQQAIGDNSYVETAKLEKSAKDRQAIIDSHLAGDVVDLKALDEALSFRQTVDAEWKAAVAAGTVFETPFSVDTEEEAIKVSKAIQDLNVFSVKQDAIQKSQQAVDAAMEGYTIGEMVGDFFLSVIEPHAETVTLRNVVADVTGEANLSGFLLPTGSINAMADKISDVPAEEAAAIILDMVDKTIDRQNQFGIGQNKGTNIFIAQTLINTINENRQQEGLAGIKNSGDLGLDLLAAVDIVGLGGVARFGKNLSRKLMTKFFGKADNIAPSSVPTLNVSVSPDMNPNLDVVKNRGSLGDVLEEADAGTVGKIIEETPVEKLDDALDAVGLDIEAVQQRSSPSVTGTIDPVSLPPSATNPRLKGLVGTLQGGFDVNLLGAAANRGAIMAKFHKDMVEATEGFPHPSKSFVRPPAEGDNLSLGTSVTRFGKNESEGFAPDDLEDAELLKSIFKAKGESVDIVQGNGQVWVEVSRRHVLNESDAGVFNNVTGQQITTKIPNGISKWYMGWSKSVQNVADGMHPQHMNSWARDLGGAIKRELQDVAQPFFKLRANPLRKKDYDDASRAIMEGEKEEVVFSVDDLEKRYQTMSKAAIEGYQSYRAAADGMQLIRAVEFGKKLSAGGYKQLRIGDSEFFGSVITERPVVGKLLTDDKGEHLVEDLVQGKRLQGDSILDAATGESVPLTQELVDELYNSGGRVVRLSSKMESGDAGSYSHVIVKKLEDLSVDEIPLYPSFGKKGYAVERFYDDAGIVIEQVGATRKLNGVDGVGREGVGIVGTVSEAKALIKHLSRKNPNATFEWKNSRELDNLLDQSQGGNGGPSWIKKRRDEALVGPVGKDGTVEEASKLSVVDAFTRSIQNTGSLPLQQTSSILKKRWLNQFGTWLSPKEKLSGDMPNHLTRDSWDNKAIRDAGLDPIVVKKDAELLQWNIKSMETEAASKAVEGKRVYLANLARSMGASDSQIAQIASRSLTKLNKANPALQLRHLTALLNIGYGVGYQVPQNVIGAFSIMSSQGVDGLRAMKDMMVLLQGVKVLNKGPDYDVVVTRLAKSLGTTEVEASNFITKFQRSGIAGSSSDLDNVLSHATTGGSVGIRPVKLVNNKVSGVVGKSIDFTSAGYWSASYRKIRKEFVAKGKKTDSPDFWEAVRNKTREFGQNQNKSDLLAFEREGNVLAFALQFTQHLLKLAHEGAGIAGRGLGLKTQSVLVDNQTKAITAAISYATIFGASGMGSTGMSFVHDRLPDHLKNPQNEIDKAVSNFILGGMLDTLVNFGTEGGIAVSAATSPAGATDTIRGYLSVVEKSLAEGKVSIDAIDALGGAAVSTFSKVASVFKALPTKVDIDEQLTEKDLLENLDFIADTFLTIGANIGRTTKLWSDAELALAMHNLETKFSKMSGKATGSATVKEAVAQAFGMSTRQATLQRAVNRDDYILKLETRAVAKSVARAAMVDFYRIVNKDDPESLDKWRASVKKRSKTLSLTLNNDSEVRKFETQMTNHMIKILVGDKGLTDRFQSILPAIGPEQALSDLKDDPRISKETLESIDLYLKIMKDTKEKGTEDGE